MDLAWKWEESCLFDIWIFVSATTDNVVALLISTVLSLQLNSCRLMQP